MRRALLTWKQVAPDVRIVSAPVPRSQFYASDRNGATVAQVRGILHEYAAIVFYWWNGWAAASLDPPVSMLFNSWVLHLPPATNPAAPLDTLLQST
jgi:hypothetical protein